uniref:RING-type E3 ubiquitin transferase n=1 Tax=Nicotiana tabacum TaxID=4097 RepID=A0A1S3YKD1_TOBAC|nr:PREDICTED: probable E3 ubiquitin-protein ligase HIP1 isoform X2 [Nicotiana tabacum]
MGQRSMSYNNQIIDLEADQRSQEYIRPEPCVLYRSFIAFPHPNVHTIVSALGNSANFYLHHLPDPREGGLRYGMSSSNGVQPRHPATNVDTAIATSSNHYNPSVAAPSASTDVPDPVNHGLHDQRPFSSTHGILGISAHSFGRNDPYMDSVRGSVKQKNHSALAGPNTSVIPVITRARESDVSLTDTVSFPPYGGNGSSSSIEDGVQRSGGCMDAGNMGVQGYQVTASNGGLTSFLYPPIPHGPPNHHHPPPDTQCVGGRNMSFSPQMTSSSHRNLRNSSSNHTNNPFQGVVDGGSRYIGPFPPTGFRFYRPLRREFMLETNTQQGNLPNMRVLLENGVAMLDVPGYHEVGDAVDQHRDMHLDIDHMSYEELLALGEQIGDVTTGLSEEAIVSNLKTRIFLSSETPCPHESATCLDHKTDFCVICQTDYVDQEKIGILECRHEYHEECVKKWLIGKNTCPICKSTALFTEKLEL